jgi:plasmid stability protein
MEATATTNMTIRNVPASDLAKLAKIAKANGRSTAAEIRLAINQHVSRGAK